MRGERRGPAGEPEPRRRIKMRTFADWNDPPPGSMEMDLVAHCGSVNRGSYVHSLVLTDIASGWTEAAPIVVREGSSGGRDPRAYSRRSALRPARAGCGQRQRVRERPADRVLPEPWNRAHPLATLPKERPGMDRAEERRHRAEAPGLSPLRGPGRRQGDHASVRRHRGCS